MNLLFAKIWKRKNSAQQSFVPAHYFVFFRFCSRFIRSTLIFTVFVISYVPIFLKKKISRHIALLLDSFLVWHILYIIIFFVVFHRDFFSPTYFFCFCSVVNVKIVLFVFYLRFYFSLSHVVLPSTAFYILPDSGKCLLLDIYQSFVTLYRT